MTLRFECLPARSLDTPRMGIWPRRPSGAYRRRFMPRIDLMEHRTFESRKKIDASQLRDNSHCSRSSTPVSLMAIRQPASRTRRWFTRPSLPRARRAPYPITASGASSPNYTITYVPGTLTVILAPATVESATVENFKRSRKR
jgi:hypothetical protein